MSIKGFIIEPTSLAQMPQAAVVPQAPTVPHPPLIKSPILHGTQWVSALILPINAREQVRSCWRHGARLESVTHSQLNAWLLRFPSAEMCDVTALPGLALIAIPGGISKTLVSCLDVPVSMSIAALVVADGNERIAIGQSCLMPLDPSTWLDLDDFPWINAPAQTLISDAPVTPILPNETPLSARSLLKGRAREQDPGALALLDASKELQTTGAKSKRSNGILKIAGEWIGSAMSNITRAVRQLFSRAATAIESLLPGAANAQSRQHHLLKGATAEKDAAASGRKNASNEMQTLRDRSKTTNGHTRTTDGMILTAMTLIASMLRQLISTRTSSGPNTSGENAVNGAAADAKAIVPPPQASWQQKLSLLTTVLGLGRLLGMQHAAFMQKMLHALDSGDWDEALRRAIPLADLRSDGTAGSPGLLTMRDGLQWTHQSGSSVGFGESLYQILEARYRACFRALDQQGKFEEAAFVLIELLRQTEEGIDYLVKHGHAREAAELAHARDLPKGKIIRLWLLAKMPERALNVVRSTQCYAEAIEMLRDRSDLARLLRLDWAEQLAKSGQYLRAVDAVWSLPDLRDQAREWMQLGKLQSSQESPEMLAKELILLPEELPRIGEEISVLLASEDELGCVRREAFARALLAPKAMDKTALQTVGPQLLRSLLADYAAARSPEDVALLASLEKQVDDPYWNADRPKLQPSAHAVPTMNRASCLRFKEIASGELLIEDVLCVGEGNYLLALGASGVLYVSATARRLHHFNVSAHRLIPGSALQVIALYYRDTPPSLLRSASVARTVELAHLDVQTCRTRPWCVTRLSAFANRFEGLLWAVGCDDALMLIDVSKPDIQAIWHASELPGALLHIDWRSNALYCIMENTSSPSSRTAQAWEYRWPGLTLAKRAQLCVVADGPIFYDAAQPVRLLAVDGFVTLRPVSLLDQIRSNWVLSFPTHWELKHVDHSANWLALTFDVRYRETLLGVASQPTSVARVYGYGKAEPVLEFTFTNGTPRIFGNTEYLLCVCGNLLLHVSLANGRVRRVLL